MNYFRTDFMPEPISCFDLTHPRRPSPLARLARWLVRPIEVWLREVELDHLRALDLEDWWREKSFEQVGLWIAAMRIKDLREVRRVQIDLRQAELDALKRGGLNG